MSAKLSYPAGLRLTQSSDDHGGDDDVTGRGDEIHEVTKQTVDALEPYIKPGKRDEAEQVLEARYSYRGPLPPASELRGYDEIMPGLVDRIVMMAEKEQNHRHTWVRDMTRDEYSLKRRGQNFALGSVAILSSVAAWLGYLGDTTSAAVVAGATLLGIVTVFVTGQANERRDESADTNAGES